ncbi:hypothetical protein [Meiothermus hypogaeus]|uniref:Uncharacterized protein n=2 Tax=Meiothermus hypogaeus TaxID=884155 RepID=A0A511R410_9DEIN|nr:hypothetical protein [Meiothermus hypogaeus]RIH77738.1 hypothetical protein Mhypo_01890 [Meiothermus hypogaeus]GEM83622.1 hypothetical protein MHY01S_17880 [Meiothermus hypogaeus NBRC 106114]GIW36636.1 MAG: hypothetical protein KatS3mg073_0781 [Meiothermus sp.]
MGIPEPILHDRLAFLSHFPPEQRSTAANNLLEAVRAGCSEPHQVVGYALEKAARRYHLEAAQTLLLLPELDFEALLAGARWALWWESLPPAEKRRIREERAEPAIERWMAEQPPTEKQLRYLASLGYRGPTPANRHEASRLIDELVKGVSRV